MRYRLRPAPVSFAVAGYALLLLSWAVSNSPGSSPDEPAHLVKALGVAAGDLYGEEADYAPGPEFGPGHLPWINSVTRSFRVPLAETFGTIATCNAFRPDQSSACIPPSLDARAGERLSEERTHVGAYQPAPYAPLGAAARLAPGGAATGVVAGRLIVAAASALLLALAAAALWSPAAGGWSLVGLWAAVTPMVIFLGASLSPIGFEIGGGICMSAAVVAIARTARPRPLLWAALGAGGATMALSRTTGPLWACALLAVLVCLTGWRGFAERVRSGRAAAVAAGAAMAIAGLATITWDLAMMPGPPRSPEWHRLLDAFAHLPELTRQAIGVFGWLDTSMPGPAYSAWRLILLVLVVLALMVGTGRERVTLLLAAVGVVVATVGLAVMAVFPTGFGTQARYTLPIAVIVPILAGETVARRRHRLGAVLPRWLPAGVAATAATVHLVGWWSNSRRHGVGTEGPIFFIGSGEWSPPLGWAVWFGVAACGTALLVAAAFAPSGGRRRGGYPGG